MSTTRVNGTQAQRQLTGGPVPVSARPSLNSRQKLDYLRSALTGRDAFGVRVELDDEGVVEFRDVGVIQRDVPPLATVRPDVVVLDAFFPGDESRRQLLERPLGTLRERVEYVSPASIIQNRKHGITIEDRRIDRVVG